MATIVIKKRVVTYSKIFGGKNFGKFGELHVQQFNLTISIALLLRLWFLNYLLSINTREASWFAVTYASSYAYMTPYGLFSVYGNDFPLYSCSVAIATYVACSIATLCH